MGIEKRKSRRTDVNVYISLRQLDDKYVSGYASDTVDVKSDYKFKPNTYYDTVVILANKERIATVIEIIRMSNSGDTETTYGCRFVGISKEDQFKIEVYQIVDESKNN